MTAHCFEPAQQSAMRMLDPDIGGVRIRATTHRQHQAERLAIPDARVGLSEDGRLLRGSSILLARPPI